MSKSFLGSLLIAVLFVGVGAGDEKIRVLLIDGQNNHAAWPQTSPMMKQTLENSGRFTVDISRTPPSDGRRPNYGAAQPTVSDMPVKLQALWDRWQPDFDNYDAIISNYNGVLWPDRVRKKFEAFVKQGGGFIVIHAADNAFAQWDEYNLMIGVGGWYGRNESNGPALSWKNNQLIRDSSPGRAGKHGKRKPVVVYNRDPEHPVTAGMPEAWLHPDDEVYYDMRGPAQNITVLATAFSDPNTGGSGREHPIVIALSYGRGRVFHNMLGHDERAFRGVGFQHLLLRGTEWAATGKVTFDPVSAEECPLDKLAEREPADVK
jgi:type 1 glutamine amidotransferase